MPWVRIDEEFVHHPKVVQVGPLGVALQVAALCYANKHLTDGFIPHGAVRLLLDFNRLGENVGERADYWQEVGAFNVANRLVEAGMWRPVPGGFQIHDYEHYQPTKAEVIAERERNAIAGKRSAQARATRRQQDGQRPVEHIVERSVDTTSNDFATQGQPVPVPVPPPTTGDPEASPVEIPRASPTGRASRSTAPSNVTPIPTAQTFVAAYVDAYRGRAGHDPPSRVKGHLAKELRRLCDDGIPPDAIKAGFIEWFDANQHPSTLASFVEVHARGGQPRGRASPTTRLLAEDRKLARWAENLEGGNPDAADGMAPHRRPARGELPRPGTPG